MQEEFKNFLSTFQYKDGELRQMSSDRYMLASTTWLTDLQQEIENIIGPDGAYAVFETASKSGGQTTSEGPTFAALFAGMSLEERVKFIMKYGQFQGWGPHEVVEYSSDPFRVVVRSPRPYIGKAYKGKADGPRCYYQVGLTNVIQALANIDKRALTLQFTETKCVAKGDPYCEYVFEVKTDD
ncbi:MAG: hypothetical protein ACFFCO_09930 [Promethearchaeota archaeon]